MKRNVFIIDRDRVEVEIISRITGQEDVTLVTDIDFIGEGDFLQSLDSTRILEALMSFQWQHFDLTVSLDTGTVAFNKSVYVLWRDTERWWLSGLDNEFYISGITAETGKEITTGTLTLGRLGEATSKEFAYKESTHPAATDTFIQRKFNHKQ